MSPRREIHDASEHVRRTAEEEGGGRSEVGDFRVRAAIAIAVLAVLLALANLGGENAANEMVGANIDARGAWDLYQATNVLQSTYAIAADRLEIEMELRGDSLSLEQRRSIQDAIDRYRATVDSLESSPGFLAGAAPSPVEGKSELADRARRHEAIREGAELQEHTFDYSSALFQMAIVLGSVAIVVVSSRVLLLALILGGVAALLMLNGFLLLVPLR